MKTIIIGRPTIIRCGIMHILEHAAGCVLMSACASLQEARSVPGANRARLFCAEVEESSFGREGIRDLMQLCSQAAVIVYGETDALSRKSKLSLVAMGIKDVINVGDPPEEMQGKIRKFLEGRRMLAQAVEHQESFAGEKRKILSVLTNREREVLKLVSLGETSKSIAYELCLSKHTVEFYRKQLMKKTGADSVAELTRIALRSGITFLWE